MYLETLRSRIDTHAKDTTVHVTADEKSLWNSLASLFELVDIGTDESPLMAIKAKYGLFTESFISARGSDPGAGSGGGGGVDMESVWYALAQPTTEKINVSHIPNLAISKITGLQAALDSKLEGITKAMVEGELTGTVTSHNHDGMYAPLSGGLIPSQYLPSYVDDVVEYASLSAFPATGESGKIYVALDTNLTYRWGGSGYVEISPSLALGHTSSTAYPGDKGAANASAIQTLQSYFSGGAAKRVAHALTLSFADGAPAVYDGSAAVEARIVSPAVLIAVAIAGIAGYAMPSQDFAAALRLWRFLLAILASAAGLFGLAAGCAALIYHLAGLETFGTPYLAPFTAGAGEPRGHPNLFRPPLPRMKWRDGARHTLNRRNQR